VSSILGTGVNEQFTHFLRKELQIVHTTLLQVRWGLDIFERNTARFAITITFHAWD
jgi:accessory gene regulator protein AgrB